jgi:hypothetical protein
MVVTRTFSDGRMDNRTMAAGSSVTWMHCSVRFEVTWGKTRRVRADAPMSARTLGSGLSYRASGGLLAGEPGRRAGGPIH